jgi:predicted nucleic acid-binding protein
MNSSVPPELVVADASPIHYLILIGAVDVLPKIFAKVVIPAFIANVELQNAKTPEVVRQWVSNLPPWTEIKHPANVESLGLDLGEEQAIALAIELKAPVLLDEKEARHIARGKGVQFIGTIGIIDRAAAKDLLDLRTALAELEKTNFYVNHKIIEASMKRQSQRFPNDLP